MSNFNYWKEEVADIPIQDEDGNWYDAETGFRFDNTIHYKTGGKTTRWTPKNDVKDHRKIAKFYGGKALTGSTKQKVWAESLRAKVLTSDALSDEQKVALLELGIVKTAKFWINNKDLAPKYFIAEQIIAEAAALNELREKHYRTLATSGYGADKDTARAEIRSQLTANTFQLGPGFDFPNFDPYNIWGVFEK